MKGVTPLRYLLCVPAIALVCACSSVPPAWVSAPNKCTVLLGGGGTVFPSNALNDHWFRINQNLSNKLADALDAKGYQVHRLIADIRDNKARIKAASAEMNRKGCNKVVQLSHSLSGVEGKFSDSFMFTVSVLGVSPKDMAFTGEYEKEYKYALTKEVMETLSLTAVAAEMAGEIEKTGLLAKAGT